MFSPGDTVISKPRRPELDAGKQYRARLGFILMSTDLAAESDFFAMKLRDFIQDRKSWEGKASELKKELEDYIRDDDIIKSKYWPTAPNKVSQKINRIGPSLRSVGIEFEFLKGGKLWKFKYK